MAILSAMLNSLGCYYPHLATNDHQRDLENYDETAALIISKVRTIAAYSYRASRGLPYIYPRRDLPYCENFLHMMFSSPTSRTSPSRKSRRAQSLPAAPCRPRAELQHLHRAHGRVQRRQPVRLHGAGVCAFWGPLHGGANMAVIEMLKSIHAEGDDGTKFIEQAKSGKADKRLMGFGHRVYKNYDPRAKIIKKSFYSALASLKIKDDPLLEHRHAPRGGRAQGRLFPRSRKLYPNVDFYSGLIMRALGIPVEHVHGHVRHRPHARLDRQLEGDAGQPEGPHLPAAPDLHGRCPARLRADAPTQVTGGAPGAPQRRKNPIRAGARRFSIFVGLDLVSRPRFLELSAFRLFRISNFEIRISRRSFWFRLRRVGGRSRPRARPFFSCPVVDGRWRRN
jgi:hypothetical protein